MCGCGPEISETVLMTKNILEAVILASAPFGAAAALVSSVILLKGPRRVISMAMLGIMVLAAVIGFSPFGMFDFLSYQVENSFISLSVIVFVGLGAVALTYWPSQSRWINWPLLSGTGLSMAAAAAIVHFPNF